MHPIEHLGKGAIPDVPDARDFRAAAHPTFQAALAAVNWSQPFILTEPPNEDQNGSGSCVAQASSYYHWQLRRKDFSRSDLYDRIVLPGGGAYVRDGLLQIVKNGQATRDEWPDPQPETESQMTRGHATADQEASDRELDSFAVDNDIDAYAAAIAAYKGVVGGLNGSNAGWVNLAEPKPISPFEWGHGLYFFGYHLHNGQKCLMAKSSWGTTGNTTIHHIKQDYFQAGAMFNAWTLIPRSTESMNLINDNGTYFLVGDKGKIGIADPDALAALKAITSQESTGSTSNVPQVKVLKRGIILE